MTQAELIAENDRLQEIVTNQATLINNQSTLLISQNTIIEEQGATVEEQGAKIAEQGATVEEQERKINSLQRQLTELVRLLNGSKRERFVPSDTGQQSLFDTPVEQAAEASPEQHIAGHTRRRYAKDHPGRASLPAHFPVEEQIVYPDVDHDSMECIGEEVHEHVEYTPASLKVIRIRRPKYKESESTRIHIAELSVGPVPKCIAGPSLISYIICNKFLLHLPFYRQAQQFKREYDWEINKSTLGSWFKVYCDVLEPLYKALIAHVLATCYLQVDESPLQVLSKLVKRKSHKGYMWVYRRADDGMVFFDYQKGRDYKAPARVLSRYAGYLQCDGYSVYDTIAKGRSIRLIGCLAHLRRKFYKAHKSGDQRAETVMEHLTQLYRSQDRAEQKQIMDAAYEWIENAPTSILPKSYLGDAIRYALRQKNKIYRIWDEYTDHDGRPVHFELDNNIIENQIRPLALGRKNYLFAGSHDGARRNAMMYSFMASCKAAGINPQEYLTDVLSRISDHPINRIHELLPHVWKSQT